MESIQVNSNFQIFNIVLYFYRIVGVSFGGVSIDNKKGLLIKSKFWHYFGWFGSFVHLIMALFVTALPFTSKSLLDSTRNSKFTIKSLI